MNKTDIRKKRRNNRNLYPIYSSIGLDYMFYYGIKVLFLSQVKGITDSQIVLSISFFSLFAIITQIPLTILIHKIGKRKGLILGNLINAFSMFLIIICPNFTFFVIEEFFSATATGIKAITEASILDLSIPKFNKKGEFYTKLKRNGYSKYCYMYATSTLLAGFLYNLNPYIPIVLCMGCCILATIISCSFKEIKEHTEEQTEYISELKNTFKFIFKSNRLRPLLVMLGLIWGLRNLFDTYHVILLKETNISSVIIGIILAMLQLNRGVMSRFAGKLNTKFKNKTLTLMALMLPLSFVITGLAALLKINIIILLIVIFIGVIFDMIGVAALTSKKENFHAMASKKIKGSKEAIEILKHADMFATICNDIVGDISGILSGGFGAVLAINLSTIVNISPVASTIIISALISFVVFSNTLRSCSS